MINEINPKETKRAQSFELWNNAPNPMVTVFKTIDVTHYYIVVIFGYLIFETIPINYRPILIDGKLAHAKICMGG